VKAPVALVVVELIRLTRALDLVPLGKAITVALLLAMLRVPEVALEGLETMRYLPPRQVELVV
jgi:hypothetical protein